MNLEHVSAGKKLYNPAKFHPKPTKLSIFSKISVHSAYDVSNEKIERIMHRMFESKLCGRQKVFDYLSGQLRHNCWPNTIRTNGTTILLFLAFFKLSGGRHLTEIGPEHISAFVEHEQDRGISPVSIEGRLNGLYAFLKFLVDRDVISADVIKRKLRIKVPDALPRAIDPEDIQQLLAVIKRPRDRALILTLLRTCARTFEHPDGRPQSAGKTDSDH